MSDSIRKLNIPNLRLEWNENNENFNLGIGSRVDIAMLDEERITKYVVEAKLRWNNENCRNDLNRIVNLVRGGVPCGFLAVLITRNNGEITERLNDIQELLEDFEHQNNGIDIKHFYVCSVEIPNDLALRPRLPELGEMAKLERMRALYQDSKNKAYERK